ncbi:MAG: translation initiation factor IF-3 [Acholeplasmataceae bacterium]
MSYRAQKEKDLVNEFLPEGKFLVIDESGEKLGVYNRNEALNIARDKSLDIFVVAPNANPMVARLMDYSKHRYDQQKRLKEMKKNQQVVRVKEVKLSPTIDTHDFNTKLRNAQRFIDAGNKVKISLRFRGRMITHKDLGFTQVRNFVEALQNITVESAPKMDGYMIISVVAPSKN